jgi:protein subunit release factor B/predicted RNA-binding Zn-ribbon protein involved in translation (DUF1610 family)
MEKLSINACPVCGCTHLKRVMTCTDFYASGEQFELYSCEDCGFTFTQGVPVEAEIGKYYETPDYISHTDTRKGAMNSVYHYVRSYMLGRKARLVAKEAHRKTGRLLDIGTGTGYFADTMVRRGWKVETLEADETGIGGMKSVNFMVTGAGAYSVLKYESGVHRVQRVPETESQGRIQTSTCSVAVMPEAEDVEVHIDDKDIRIDVMRASGNGGQCVNTTDSAVRLTHYPTGIVIYSQTEKSQIQNKEKAFALLRTKLYDLELQKKQDAESEERRSQIGTGDRSEKIRTYNFPQGRVTDHRINLTLYKLDKILDGDIQEIIDACIAADQAKKLAKMQDEN